MKRQRLRSTMVEPECPGECGDPVTQCQCYWTGYHYAQAHAAEWEPDERVRQLTEWGDDLEAQLAEARSLIDELAEVAKLGLKVAADAAQEFDHLSTADTRYKQPYKDAQDFYENAWAVLAKAEEYRKDKS